MLSNLEATCTPQESIACTKKLVPVEDDKRLILYVALYNEHSGTTCALISDILLEKRPPFYSIKIFI